MILEIVRGNVHILSNKIIVESFWNGCYKRLDVYCPIIKDIVVENYNNAPSSTKHIYGENPFKSTRQINIL